MRIFAMMLGLGGSLVAQVTNGTNIGFDQPLAVIGNAISCDKVYRVTMPLRGEGHTLAVVFAFPSHKTMREAGIQDTAERAMELSKLYYGEKRFERVLDAGVINVDRALFTKLLVVLAKSEVFSLPAKREARFDDYLLLTVFGEDPVTAERYSDGKEASVTRVYGESASATYLANQLATILGKACGKKWAAGHGESENEATRG